MTDELKGATRLSLTFRFETSSWQLDRKALRDMDRLVDYLARPEFADREIIFVGFAVARGPLSYNIGLSRNRASAVLGAVQSLANGAALRERNMVATGFGELAPMGWNDNVMGLSRNRWVEVWVR